MCKGPSDVGIQKAPICSNRHKLENRSSRIFIHSRAELLAGLFPYFCRLCRDSLFLRCVCAGMMVFAVHDTWYCTKLIFSFHPFVLSWRCSSSGDPDWPPLGCSRVLEPDGKNPHRTPWITMQQGQCEMYSVVRGYEKWKCCRYIHIYNISPRISLGAHIDTLISVQRVN